MKDPAKQRLKEIGLDPSHIAYICGMAQDVYTPDQFTLDVQRCLDEMEKEEEHGKS
jgi:hypothetical protein